MLEIILAGFIQWETIQTQIKEDNVSGIELSSYILHNDSDDNRVAIIPGDSVWQREERERIAKENYERIRQQTIAREKAERTVRSSTSGTNPYIYGFCTWWVAKEKGITQIWGDAKYWPVNSSVPAVGAVIVTYESWRGHVGIIREINGTQVKIEEMNYVGWNRVSTRVVDYRTIPVKGFLVI